MARRSSVSVIMPFLNAASFIGEAVESVVTQTYEEWELLLVDDGSTDGSSDIARAFADKDPTRVRYFEHEAHENRGASASRNLALKHASGTYIAFLDADDVFLPDKLERQVEILDKRPEVGMTYGETEWWYGWTGKRQDLARNHVRSLGQRLNQIHEAPSLFIPLFLKDGIMSTPCTCSLMVRREVVEQVGGFEDAFRQIFTDQAFYAKLFLTTSAYVEDACRDRYRQHFDSSCHRVERSGDYLKARLFFLDWLGDYLRSANVEDKSIWKAYRTALRRLRHPRFYQLVDRAYDLRLHARSLRTRAYLRLQEMKEARGFS